MCLGTVLLRPQILATEPPVPGSQQLEVFFEFVTRLGRELATEGPGLRIIEDELTASFDQLNREVEPRLNAARVRILSLVNPVVNFVDQNFSGAAGAGDFKQFLETGRSLLGTLATLTKGLTAEKLKRILETLFDILEIDLGLNEARFRRLFSELTDRIASRMQSDFLNGADDGAAYNRFALGCSLGELRNLVSQNLVLPPLNKEIIFSALNERLQALNIDQRAGEAAEMISRISAALESVLSLQLFLDVRISPQTDAPSPASVSRRQFSASRAALRATLFDAEAASEQTSWYASWLNGDVVKHEDPINNPDLAQVDFKRISAPTMEKLAFHSKWAACLIEATLHASSLERGDFASNTINIIWRAGFEASLAGFANYAPPSWVPWTVIPAITTVGGFEFTRFNDWFGPLQILTDLAETQLYARWVWLARQSLLSSLTLANNNATRFRAFVEQAEREAITDDLKKKLELAKRNHNHNQIEGLAHIFGEFGAFLVPLILSKVDEKNYGFPSKDHSADWGRVVLFFLAGWATSLTLTWVAGDPLARVLSGDTPENERFMRLYFKDRIFGRFKGGGGTAWDFVKGILFVPGSAALDHIIYYYLLGEGATDGGKFSGRQDSAGNDIKYLGYQNPSSSPYKLPWEKGKVNQCSQGNQGIVSHSPISGPHETYAYDFALDNGEEVLAMRGGVVWDFSEGTPDGEEPKNFITILHDPPPLVPPEADSGDRHDFNELGDSVRTFAIYLHGKEHGVTGAFGFTPTKRRDSPVSGAPVTQGQVIMLADHTGRSAFNHVHVQIEPINSSGNPDDYTIPFVFNDVGGDGVPQSLNYYESGNEKKP